MSCFESKNEVNQYISFHELKILLVCLNFLGHFVVDGKCA